MQRSSVLILLVVVALLLSAVGGFGIPDGP